MKVPESGRGYARSLLFAVGAVVGGLVIALIAYYVGQKQGDSRVALVQESRQRDVAALSVDAKRLEGQAKELTVELESLRQRAMRLEARRDLHLAILTLDDQNFGLAQGYLRDAARRLQGSSPPPELAELAKDVGATVIASPSDIETQRARIKLLANRFDELVPPASPPPP